jgi:hypothetical protein
MRVNSAINKAVNDGIVWLKVPSKIHVLGGSTNPG